MVVLLGVGKANLYVDEAQQQTLSNHGLLKPHMITARFPPILIWNQQHYGIIRHKVGEPTWNRSFESMNTILEIS